MLGFGCSWSNRGKGGFNRISGSDMRIVFRWDNHGKTAWKHCLCLNCMAFGRFFKTLTFYTPSNAADRFLARAWLLFSKIQTHPLSVNASAFLKISRWNSLQITKVKTPRCSWCVSNTAISGIATFSFFYWLISEDPYQRVTPHAPPVIHQNWSYLQAFSNNSAKTSIIQFILLLSESEGLLWLIWT